jgi:hypothetical protein
VERLLCGTPISLTVLWNRNLILLAPEAVVHKLNVVSWDASLMIRWMFRFVMLALSCTVLELNLILIATSFFCIVVISW